MNTSLNEWDERFNQHFSLLHRERGTRALFALEHGLDFADTENFVKAILAHVASKPPSDLHSLAWIVYAAEIGYGYCGDEYWQTFEQKTPGWSIRGDRGWLRDRYEWFHKTFGGAAPSGPWARHFSIICWPITHAILPRDLQRQLAQILYESRHSFSADLFESPMMLGKFIAARSCSTTSRFQNLAEEPEFIGQIASALLLQDDSGTTALLHPTALCRISADLERERMARSWLRIARQAAKERALARGLSTARDGAPPIHPRLEETRAEIKSLGIEPRLLLRPKDHTGQIWSVSLEIPDLSHLLPNFPTVREVLTQSRCVVAGTSGRPLARGQCLYGPQSVALARWPRQDEVLLQFDKRDLHLEAILRTECLLRPGPLWLFRIASDGLAYEVRTLRVRPREKYIAVTTDTNIISQPTDAPAITLECAAAKAIYLSLPDVLDNCWEKFLQQLGLKHVKTIEVWPVGLTPARWDDDGHGEWLASEKPYLGIRADHVVREIVITIVSSPHAPLALDNSNPGSVLFVELPALPVGLHTIHFSTRCSEGDIADPINNAEFLIRIRESRPRSPRGRSQGPLLARIEPINPTLEQLWEGRVEIAFQGPPGRQLKCTVILVDLLSDDVKRKVLPSLPLPVDASTWAHHFDQHIKRERAVCATYDTARACELQFSAEELGAFTLWCEREPSPLRWALHHKKAIDELRLLDDSGHTASPRIARRTFERPHEEEPLAAAPVYSVPASGGIYIASLPSREATIIVPPVIEGLSLSQLCCNPLVEYAGDTKTALSRAWTDAELWSRAKLSGNIFSLTRQREVLKALQRYTIQALCGHEWARMETAYYDHSKSLGYLQRAMWKANYESEVAARFGRDYKELAALDIIARIREMVWAAKFLEGSHSATQDSEIEWLAELALRIASDPAEVRNWAGNGLNEGLDYLMHYPTLMRAARFLVVAIDQFPDVRGLPHELYATWGWR